MNAPGAARENDFFCGKSENCGFKFHEVEEFADTYRPEWRSGRKGKVDRRRCQRHGVAAILFANTLAARPVIRRPNFNSRPRF